MAEICRRLDTSMTGEPQEVYDTMSQRAGFGWDELKEKGFINPSLNGTNTRKTASIHPQEKLTLFHSLRTWAMILAFLQGTTRKPLQYAELAEDYPFILITGARIPMFSNLNTVNCHNCAKGGESPSAN